MANEWKNEKKKENRGVTLFLLTVIGIGLAMLLSKFIENHIGQPNLIIQSFPLFMILTSYFIWHRKDFYVFIIFSLFVYGISLYDLSNPFIKEYIENYKYRKLDGKIVIPDKEVSTTNGVNIKYDCTSLEFSNIEHCHCIESFGNFLEKTSSESIQEKVRSYQVLFDVAVENEISKEKKMKVFLKFGKRMLEYDNLISENYLKKGLVISNELKDFKYSMLFKYYLGIGKYLSRNYTESKILFNSIINESNNHEMRMLAFHGLLQVKKNNYELLTQKDFDFIQKRIKDAQVQKNKTFEFLFNVLKGDMFLQNIFYQSARDIYSETNEMLLNEEVKMLLPQIYRRLGYTYKTKGAFERAFYYTNKSKNSLEGGLREEGDVMDFFIADIMIEKEHGLSYVFRLLREYKEDEVLINSLLTLHYASQDSCNSGKDISELNSIIDNNFIKPNIKRRVLFNISRYYELIENKEMALLFAKKVDYYNNNLFEKVEYHQYLGEFYFYKLKNISNAIFHAEKMLNYCANSPKDLEYVKLFKTKGIVDEKALGKVYFIMGKDNVGRLSFVFRHGSTTKSIESFGLLSEIYYSVYLDNKDNEDLNKSIDYLEKLINHLEKLIECAVCEVDKQEISVVYYDWLDLYIRIGSMKIGLTTEDKSISERMKRIMIDEIYRKLYFAIELVKTNSTLFGLNKNYISFLNDKSELLGNLEGLNEGVNNINEEIIRGKSTLDQIDSLKQEKYKLLSKKERHLSLVDTTGYKNTLNDNDLYMMFDGSKFQMFKMYENKHSSLFDLMSNLEDDEMFLNYYHSRITNQLFVMVISKGNMEIMNKDLTHDIDTLGQELIPENLWYPAECNLCYVHTFKKWIEKESMKYKVDYSKVGKKMYDVFFPTLHKEVKRVYISNHGITNYLPFEVFLTESTDIQDFSDLPYLFKKHEIVYTVSGTFLYGLKKKNDSKVKAKLLNIAPFERKNINTDTVGFKGLTSSRIITDYFNGKKNTLSLLGKDASLNKVKEKISNFNVLHFSTHGEINLGKPMDSQLLMYPDTTLEEGKLHLYELLMIKIKAKLSVLAACETGNNILTNTGSSNNFINAFHYAGCPTVVGTQWKVNDTSTGEILVYFYQFLEEGETVSGALRSAKLKYLEQDRRDGEYHPYYWAGLVVSGNPDMKISFD